MVICSLGEEDQDAYDISRLKKPIDENPVKKPPLEEMPVKQARPRYRRKCILPQLPVGYQLTVWSTLFKSGLHHINLVQPISIQRCGNSLGNGVTPSRDSVTHLL